MQSERRKLAAVTGASSGIGFELAKQFAEHGFDLILVAENEDIHEVAPSFENLGASVLSYQIDLSTRAGVESFFRAIKDTERPLDAIALNAGIATNGRFIDTDLDEELTLVSLNVASNLHLAKLIAKDMVARGEGKILFTSSVAAITPGPYMAAYHASKAFVRSLGLALRYELKETGVTVTVLMPDATDTAIFERAGMEDTKIGSSDKDSAATVARQGFEALMAGKESVVGGSWMNAATVALGKFAPESLKAARAAKLTEPGSAR